MQPSTHSTGPPPTMSIATALVSGNDPLPQWAEQAIQQALAKAGKSQANSVLLFLTPEFAQHGLARQAIAAAARAARCTQIAGAVASGVFTEAGWVVDRPAVAAMVFCGDISLSALTQTPSNAPSNAPLFSYAGGGFPREWAQGARRFGSTFSGSAEPPIWQNSRLLEQQSLSLQFTAARVSVDISCGWQLLAPPRRVERCNGYDLDVLGGQAALSNLVQLLPAKFRQDLTHTLHHISAVLVDDETQPSPLPNTPFGSGAYRPIPIIATTAHHSVTLAERIEPGRQLAWAIRQPLGTEADMRAALERLAAQSPAPACALMLSCIGRGPYFYGGDDRDLIALCERFPGLPVIGTYGTGQISPLEMDNRHRETNRHWQNSVVTALISPI